MVDQTTSSSPIHGEGESNPREIEDGTKLSDVLYRCEEKSISV